MKTKKYLIALAIFGGMVFLAQSADSLNDNGAETAKVERAKIKVPTHG